MKTVSFIVLMLFMAARARGRNTVCVFKRTIPQSQVLDVNGAAIPGLYAAGEVLDVDGDCGGFNLQFAWSSAYVAAQSIIQNR